MSHILITKYNLFHILITKYIPGAENDRPPRLEEQEFYTVPLQPLDEKDLLEVIVKGTNPVAKVALLFYVLTVNKAMAERMARLARGVGTPARGGENKAYPPRFLKQLPIKNLLHIAETDASHIYPDIFPVLHALVLDEYPEFFNVRDALRDMLHMGIAIDNKSGPDDDSFALQSIFSTAPQLLQLLRKVAPTQTQVFVVIHTILSLHSINTVCKDRKRVPCLSIWSRFIVAAR